MKERHGSRQRSWKITSDNTPLTSLRLLTIILSSFLHPRGRFRVFRPFALHLQENITTFCNPSNPVFPGHVNGGNRVLQYIHLITKFEVHRDFFEFWSTMASFRTKLTHLLRASLYIFFQVAIEGSVGIRTPVVSAPMAGASGGAIVELAVFLLT